MPTNNHNKPKSASKDARPTSGKVLGALFSILDSAGLTRETSFLDLFAGTGQVGMKALERGAASLTVVESERGRMRKIAESLAKYAESKTIVTLCLDVRRALPKLARDGTSFDVIFADPPYGMGWGESLPLLLRENIALLKEGGVFILERSVRDKMADVPWARDDRIYGETVLSIYTRTVEAD